MPEALLDGEKLGLPRTETSNGSAKLPARESASPEEKESAVQELSQTRERVGLVEIDQAARGELLTQAAFLFDQVYAFTKEKQKKYGFDARLIIENLRRESPSLDSQRFLNELSLIFNRFEDGHLRVVRPKPVRCVKAVLPFEFVRVLHGDGTPRIALHRKKNGLLSAYKEPHLRVLQQLREGDLLTRYGSYDPVTLVDDRSWGGLHDYVRAEAPEVARNDAVELLSIRSGSSVPLPSEDFVTLEFEAQVGNIKIDLPWMSILDGECLGVAPDVMPPFIEDEGQSGFTPTDEPTIGWKLIPTPSGKVGVISISSFSPEVVEIAEALELISGIVHGQFEGVSGVLIDVRGNSGGNIFYSSLLPKVFSSTYAAAVKFRYRNTTFLRKVFSLVPWMEWRADEAAGAFDGILPEDEFASPTSYVKGDEISKVVTVFDGPVGLIVDSFCASSCDMLAANFRDNAIGKIWSVNSPQTSGSGANVSTYNDLAATVAQYFESDMRVLPAEFDFRFPRSQAVRIGDASLPLEGRGVSADFVRDIRSSDLNDNGEALLSGIAVELLSQAR